MHDSPITFTLHVSPKNRIDDDRLQDLTRSLQRELREHNGVSAEPLKSTQPTPTGALSADPLTLGALAVVVLPAVLPALITFMRDWRLRNSGMSLTIRQKIGDREIEITVPEHFSQEQLESYLTLIGKQLGDDSAQEE